MISPEARGAWKDLESHLRPYLARRVASPADVDDLLQEVFVRLYRSVGQLRDDEGFGGWVYRVARNVIADSARARARRQTVPFDGDRDAKPDDGEFGDLDEFQAELTECVALFVSRLPSPYREAITLTELQGLSQKRAAELLDVSLSGMKSRVQRGREKIRHMFEECCQISLDARGNVVECEPRNLAEVQHDCRDVAVAWANRGTKCQ